jgi:hypothetical protein
MRDPARRGTRGSDDMADIYEFHVTGLIGPVVRSALPELTSEPDCRRTLLSGSAEPGEVSRLLEQLRDNGLLLQHVVLSTENRWAATGPQCRTGQVSP